MNHLKFALESERTFSEIDEKEYEKRRLLNACLEYKIYGKDKKTGKSLLSKEQQLVLKDYFDFLLAMKRSKKNSPHTVYHNIEHISFLGRDIIKPFSEMNKTDLISYFANCQIPKNGKKGVCNQTILTRQLSIRKFFRWLHDDEDAEIVSWMKITIRPKKSVNKSELLTIDEIKQMVSCSNKRNACMIMIAYECGLRAGELVSIRLKSIMPSDQGSKIKVEGKSGERTAFVIDADPYLRDWLNEHPYKDNLEAPLFVNLSNNQYGRQLKPSKFGDIIKLQAKRAGIKKRVYPHLLRHSILNHLGKNGFKERDLRIFAGWSSDSKMPDVYLHYDEEEVEKKLRKFKGIIDEVDVEKEFIENKKLTPKICSRCKQSNPATAVYCNCGLVLNVKTLFDEEEKKESADNILNKLFEHDEFKLLVKKILKGEETS